MRVTELRLKAEAELPDHMARVDERWRDLQNSAGQAALMARVADFSSRVDARKRATAHSAARRAKSTLGKVVWLRTDADNVLAAASGSSACARGCSHCCNIGVTLSQAEAEVIAKAIGRKLARPAPERLLSHTDMDGNLKGAQALDALDKQRQWQLDAYHGVPCTFLNAQGACSIYEERPLVCRWQVNMDRDALLCELVPADEGPIRVPYLDQRDMHMVYATTFVGSPLADIRDWFPRSAR